MRKRKNKLNWLSLSAFLNFSFMLITYELYYSMIGTGWMWTFFLILMMPIVGILCIIFGLISLNYPKAWSYSWYYFWVFLNFLLIISTALYMLNHSSDFQHDFQHDFEEPDEETETEMIRQDSEDSVRYEINTLQVFTTGNVFDSVIVIESYIGYMCVFEIYDFQEDMDRNYDYELVNEPDTDGFRMYHSVMVATSQKDTDAGIDCFYLDEIIIYLSEAKSSEYK
jgi:hypothetical protein